MKIDTLNWSVEYWLDGKGLGNAFTDATLKNDSFVFVCSGRAGSMYLLGVEQHDIKSD